jgi:mono/diheme cytochrome c family protein
VTVAAGQSVSFVGAGSDPNGLTFTGHWDFGDSVSADGLSVSHTYAAAGTNTVTFTVTNSQGLTSAPDQRTVTVTAAATATLSMIQAQIFTPKCSGCHPPNQGLNLEAGNAFADIVSVNSSEQPSLMRVKPGDPDNSYLYKKVAGAAGISGSRMPQGGPFLTSAQLQLIRDWILAGAQNN